MSEVEELCDRAIFINNGKIIANDLPQNLSKTIETCHVELLVRNGLDKIKAYCNKTSLPYAIIEKHIVVDVKEKYISEFLQGLSDHGVAFDEISIEKPTLEDYFLEVSKTKS
jgi:ABC-2 type transport system ATP-binding protein